MPILISCPYYRYEQKLKTKCEFCEIKFPNSEARRRYIKEYCASQLGYKKCTLAKMSEEFYESCGK